MYKNIKSPIFYMGNKFRLLDDLKKHTPDKIRTFVDVFGGSGNVALNFSNRSQLVIYNELDENVFKLFKYVMFTDYNKIHNFITEQTDIWGISHTNINAKENFYKLRDHINLKGLYKYPKWNYLMSQFSFCNTISFNQYGWLIVSYGNRDYSPETIKHHIMHSQYYLSKNLKLYNLSFEKLLSDEFIESLNPEDYVYLDPPYINTKAHYNKGWDMELETTLLSIIEKLHERDIRFGLSNIYSNKYIVNTHLVEWVNKHSFNVVYPNIKYAYGSNSDSESVEVFITNYTKNHQIKLFGEEEK